MIMAVSKAYELIQKLQKKYGIASKSKIPVPDKPETATSPPLPLDWILVDSGGRHYRLPKTMIFLGREECDILIESESVDKRHAVVTFDHCINRFKIKDLSTDNGTFVNQLNIPEQKYVTLNHLDAIRLGTLYRMEQSAAKENAEKLQAIYAEPDKIPAWAHRELSHMAECKHRDVGSVSVPYRQGCIAEQAIQHTCDGHVTQVIHAPHMLPQMHHSFGQGQIDAMGNYAKPGTNTWSRKGMVPNMPPNIASRQYVNKGEIIPEQDYPAHYEPSMWAPPRYGHVHTCVPHSQSMYPPGARPLAYPMQNGMYYDQIDSQALDHSAMANPQYEREVVHSQHSTMANPQYDREAARSQHGAMGNQQYDRAAARSQQFSQRIVSEQHTDKTTLASVEQYDDQPSKQAPSAADSCKDEVTESCPTSNNAESDKSSVPLVKDSEAAKKGTPLYGQPSWWGENEEKEALKQSIRPDQDITSPMDNPPVLDSGMQFHPNMDIYKSDPKYAATYMEIPSRDTNVPLRDMEPERDQSSVKEQHRVSTKHSMHSSDPVKPESPKLLHSTPYEKPPSTVKQATPEKEVVPAPILMECGGSTSFTIDFSDNKSKKKSSGTPGSLSEFLPSKIRRSFRQRLEGKSLSLKDSKEDITDSPTQVNKSDDGKQPDHAQMKRSRRSGYHSEGNHSALSSDGEDDLSIKSDLTYDAVAKPDKKSSRSRKSESPKAVSAKPRSKGRRSPVEYKLETSPVTVAKSRSKSSKELENQTYLIDKMFQGKKGVKNRPKLSDQFPEYELYKEARLYDSEMTAGLVTDVPRASDNKADIHSDQKSLGKEDDNVSDAGTYTIEDDVPAGPENLARQSIEETFGVSESLDNFAIPSLDKMERQQHHLTSKPEKQVFYSGLNTDKENQHIKNIMQSCSMDVEVGSHVDSHLNGSSKENSPETSYRRSPPVWDSNWDSPRELESADMERSRPPAGANQRKADDMERSRPPAGANQRKADDMERSRPPAGANQRKADDMERSRPPAGANQRKAGRKLPDLPGANNSPKVSENHRHSEKRNFKNENDAVSKETPKRLHESRTKCASPGSLLSNRYSRSVGSMDTELLLRDTESVMAAMEQRVAFKQGSKVSRDDTYDNDSDGDSTMAVVNGDDRFINPSKFESPRQVLSNQKYSKNHVSEPKSKPPSNISSSTRPTTKRRSNPGAKAVDKDYRIDHHRVERDSSVVSDIMSESDLYETASIHSEVSTDRGSTCSPGFNRQGSKGKGTITMTRPNRAFQLRRARADDVPPGGPSDSSKASRDKRKTSKAKPSEQQPSARSDLSLGAKIVKQSRENKRLSGSGSARSSQDGNFERTDGGRHSLRMTKSNAVSVKQKIAESSRKADLKTVKSQLKGTRIGQDLNITGVGRKSNSQPNSRSNSPRSAEKLAWKRRKEYDPRKAVADAKAKSKGAASRDQVSANQNGEKNKIVRSASVSTPEGVHHLRHDTYTECESTDDFNSVVIEERDNFDEEAFTKGFLPYSRFTSKDFSRSSISTDDDSDSGDRLNRSQSYDNLIISSIYQLSLKLKAATERTLQRAREQQDISCSPIQSPTDDYSSHASHNEMPAWKSANQELAEILRNMRITDHHIQVIDRVLFPEDETSSEATRLSSEKRQYREEIERIRTELAGFQPIDNESWRSKQNEDDDEACDSEDDTYHGEDFY